LLRNVIVQFEQQLYTHQQYFLTNTTRDLNWRRRQLNKIKAMIAENESRWLEALKSDLGKPTVEAWMTETSYLIGDVDHMLAKLKKWSKPRRVHTPIVVQPGRSFVVPEPQGTVLIIGAWNYPLQLVIAPLIAAIAAGNCAVLKPSELSPATSSLIAELVPQYIDNKAVSVVEGAVEETTALLALNFDHIMYTGNGMVGRIVMAAAAKHLTPVTLELGGKSPVFVDDSADLDISAQRIAWGKWLNAGQTCIAPDYILIKQSLIPSFVEALTKHIKKMFGENAKDSTDYGRIVNEIHCQRLASYLDGLDVEYGGNFDIEAKYFEPTIVVNPTLDSQLMTDEIFGAILPIVPIAGFNEAKAFIKERDKPLSAYIFTKDKEQEKAWIREISAGNQGINDVILFNAVADLPFGGTGPSGMGQYSGQSGFDNFSHLKSVLKRPFLRDLPIRFAPFTSIKHKLLKLVR